MVLHAQHTVTNPNPRPYLVTHYGKRISVLEHSPKVVKGKKKRKKKKKNKEALFLSRYRIKRYIHKTAMVAS
jgi:hypothetical protein